MASDYGLNFGFRRSDESYRSAEGRLRVAAADTNLLLGTAVKQNTATPGELTACAADDALVPGVSGLLLQELAWLRSNYESPMGMIDSFELGKAKAGHLAVVTAGAGVKVWLKNTAGETRADGRVIPAVTMVDFANDAESVATTLAVGDQLGWSGTAWVKITTGVTVGNAWMQITDVNVSRTYLEAVLLA